MTLSGGISCALLSASPLFVFMSGISSLVHPSHSPLGRFERPDKRVPNTSAQRKTERRIFTETHT